jgi:hypothetical protein
LDLKSSGTVALSPSLFSENTIGRKAWISRAQRVEGNSDHPASLPTKPDFAATINFDSPRNRLETQSCDPC